MSGPRILAKEFKIVSRAWNLQSYLYLIERVMLSRARSVSQPQIFIIGLPRSGTTLIYQYLAHRMRIAYFTNGVGRYPLTPCIVTYFQSRIWSNYVSDFESRYGKVAGPSAPREAGGFWNRHFDSERYQSFKDISPEHLDVLQRTIWCVQRICGDVPFVNKNVKHLLRITALNEIFPNCYFLVVERDLTATALSMLRARRHLFGDSRQWWSVRPPDYAQLRDLPLPEQITGQYFSLVEKMEKDLANVSSERILRISYNNFCRNPDGLIDQIRAQIPLIEYKNGAVDSFPITMSVPTTAEEKKLVRMVECGQR